MYTQSNDATTQYFVLLLLTLAIILLVAEFGRPAAGSLWGKFGNVLKHW